MEYFILDSSECRRFIDFRAHGISHVRVLGHYEEPRVQAPLQEHSHGEMLEFTYLERGTQNYEVSGEMYQMRGGNIFAAFPGELHSTAGSPQTRGSLYWMLISVPKGKQAFLDLPKADGRALLQELLHLPRHLFAGRPSLLPLLRGLFAEARKKPSPLQVLRLRLAVWQFLTEVAASAYEEPSRTVSVEIARACAFAREHPEEILGVPELSERAGLSGSHFSRKFREEMGMSVSDFVLGQKIVHAGRLLRTTRATVTDVAMRLGFSSSQYFATVFKRHTGQSPKEIRRPSGNSV